MRKKGVGTSSNGARRHLAVGVIVIFAAVAIGSYFTNPFTRFSTVRDPFLVTQGVSGQLEISTESIILLRKNILARTFAGAKSIYYIWSGVYAGGRRAEKGDVQQIIKEIHRLRFSTSNIYLISGDHFTTLYPRSLGIFYHSLLDSRTALDDVDWSNRQGIYLRTVAYALDVYAKAPQLSTTIVPIGPRSVVLFNIYSPPSDTLYSLLYALRTLQNNVDLLNIYPANLLTRPLQTQVASQDLLNQHHDDLERHLQTYLQSVVDTQTGLIRGDILLSGTKDVMKRKSAFYDNVILWRTEQLAQQLGLTATDVAAQQKLADLKSKILATFWNESAGCFTEDLSTPIYHYSSDWLIVLMTGFLQPTNAQELPYFVGCVKYLQAARLDQPFGLKYQTTPQRNREYFLVRWLLPSYGSTAIWSNWGMEYIKLLVLLYRTTGETAYLATAQKQLAAYTQNILTNRCYPEVYDANGKMLKNLFYKSVCQTGWVVSYEQAAAMVSAAQSVP